MRSKCIRCNRFGGRNSSYKRRSDGKKVIQYRCVGCKRTWTPATSNSEKHQQRRSENRILRRLLVSGVTQNRIAWILEIDRKTVGRRVSSFAQQAREELKLRQAQYGMVREVYVDELITFEHTRCKPLAVFMAVSEKREILGFRVSSMPPIGKHLRKISLKKYGKRPNHRRKGVEACLKEIQYRVNSQTRFKSDEEPSYGQIIANLYPECMHQTSPSKRAVIAGQGELKDKSFDPIFPINHTFAMLRANIARLIRRTWSTTKKVKGIEDLLTIYAQAHNTWLIPQPS